MTLTVDQVRQFLQQMDEEEEFDDIELDAVALAVVTVVEEVVAATDPIELFSPVRPPVSIVLLEH